MNSESKSTPFSLKAFIARRYLFSRKEKTVVNLISWISLAGIAVSTLALVVVMSVYNGIGELTQSLFNVFDPELLVEPSQGKTFHTEAIDFEALERCEGVKSVSQLVEENAWITLRQAESIVQLRGVDDHYASTNGLDTMLMEGEYLLKGEMVIDGEEVPAYYLLLGWNIMVRLGVNSMTNTPLAVHIPKRGSSAIGLSMDEAFNNGYAFPAGTFRIQEEIDNQYVLADIDFVRSLMSYDDDEVTALAVAVDDPRHLSSVKQQLGALLGDGFTVKDRMDQNLSQYGNRILFGMLINGCHRMLSIRSCV